MSKKNKGFKLAYPGERGDRIKDANNKLRSENRNLKKRIKKLEQENKTLKRAFDKSCEFIEDKLYEEEVENIIEKVNDYEYKETQRGRDAKKQEKEKNKIKCPVCQTEKGKGYSVIEFAVYELHTCKCGHRERVDKSERVKGS